MGNNTVQAKAGQNAHDLRQKVMRIFNGIQSERCCSTRGAAATMYNAADTKYRYECKKWR